MPDIFPSHRPAEDEATPRHTGRQVENPVDAEGICGQHTYQVRTRNNRTEASCTCFDEALRTDRWSILRNKNLKLFLKILFVMLRKGGPAKVWLNMTRALQQESAEGGARSERQ